MTMQVPDRVVYEGEKCDAVDFPEFPKDDPRLIKYSVEDLRYHWIALSSACWRQYVCTWEVKNNELYIIHLDGRYRLIDNTAIFAHWYTGSFRIHQGECIYRSISGAGKLHEKLVVLDIHNGKVMKSTVHTNTRQRH